MNRIKQWYQGLSSQWKATLRTAFQSAVGAVLVFILAAINEAIELLNGGGIDETVSDLSNAARLLALGLLATLSGLVTFVMNRDDKGATYPPPPPPPPPPDA